MPFAASTDPLSRAVGGSDLLDRLAAGQPIPEPVALVCAHPDDELVGMGSRLCLFERLTLMHVTDGAPLDMSDARRAGFLERADYVRARVGESAAGLLVAQSSPGTWIDYGITDQCALDRVAELTTWLARDLAGQAAVFTHAYEGGHPDHDACALAVQLACARMGGAAPARLEFAGYHGEDGRLVANAFYPDPATPATTVELTPAERALKREAYAAHGSQADTLARLAPEREAWRVAPSYDFAAPPPPGEALYDGYGWPLTSGLWREKAAEALKRLLA